MAIALAPSTRRTASKVLMPDGIHAAKKDLFCAIMNTRAGKEGDWQGGAGNRVGHATRVSGRRKAGRKFRFNVLQGALPIDPARVPVEVVGGCNARRPWPFLR